MEKQIGAFEARRKFGQLLEEAFYNKDSFIVQRAGRPMAVIVSYEDYQQWRALAKEQVFRMLEGVWQRNQNVPTEELETEVEQAITTLHEPQPASITNGKP